VAEGRALEMVGVDKCGAGPNGAVLGAGGAGGVVEKRAGAWRVDVEAAKDPATGRRRRVSRYVHGTREDAEVALARLKVADHEKRLQAARPTLARLGRPASCTCRPSRPALSSWHRPAW
jgi:hypothetical protein